MSSVLWKLMIVCLSVGRRVVLLGSELVPDQDNYNHNNNVDNGERNHYCYGDIARG